LYFPWSFEWDIDLEEAYGLVDRGDCPIAVGNAVRTHRFVEREILNILEGGAIPVTIDGDHSLSIPGARALSRFLGEGKRMGYLQIDAHLDAGFTVGGEEETNCSGLARVTELPNVSAENVAIVGVHGTLNPREWFDFVRERGIGCYPMREVKRRGSKALWPRRSTGCGGAPTGLSDVRHRLHRRGGRGGRPKPSSTWR
jgi:agmatinase